MSAPRAARIVVLNWRDRRHPAAGGAELYCERVARELAADGHRVTLVTSRPTGTPAREVVDGYVVRRMGGWVTVYPLALGWLLRHRRGVDAVLDSANGIPFFSPLVAGRTPVVLLVHHVHQDLFTRSFHPLAARFAAWLEGPATRRVYGRRNVVVLSPSTRKAVRRRLHLRGPVRVVPGGADTRGVSAAAAEQPRVVVIGRLSPYKRLDTLVAAVHRVAPAHPGLELHLVGEGTDRERLQRLATELGAPVVFHGRLPDVDRDAVLATAWLSVSASDGGDWALSLLEANAAGVPALARRATGARDTVRHGETGWLVDDSEGAVSDPVAVLATAVDRALAELADPDTAQRLRSGARDWARRFTWRRTADGVLAALVSEHERTSRSWGRPERRAANDVAVVVELPRDVLPEGWRPEAVSRRGDRWLVQDDRVRALLPGADEVDALGLLSRLDVDAHDPSISLLVARHADVVDLTRPAAPGSQPHRPGGLDVA
ncbi:glycosyltransferase family 4 protein [Streptomyces sp. NP160]|uniref:glycosyltransferase family 4 protein n=1 Tax=Streptomyces sp. NP160 TaxID=2586637 RepID=UPI001118B224|nr:glycosyltransferase family 4 protein [Streptomyces sp. NP160]TNM64222.1 glycosyltransferase family 4 protein [Streptomyces sp. NP160]